MIRGFVTKNGSVLRCGYTTGACAAAAAGAAARMLLTGKVPGAWELDTPKGVRLALPGLVQNLEHPVNPEKLIPVVGGLGQAVRILKEHIARLQPNLIIAVSGLLHATQYQAVAVVDELKGFSGPPQHGLFMPPVAGDQPSGGQVQYAKPYRDEHAQRVILAE